MWATCRPSRHWSTTEELQTGWLVSIHLSLHFRQTKTGGAGPIRRTIGWRTPSHVPESPDVLGAVRNVQQPFWRTTSLSVRHHSLHVCHSSPNLPICLTSPSLPVRPINPSLPVCPFSPHRLASPSQPAFQLSPTQPGHHPPGPIRLTNPIYPSALNSWRSFTFSSTGCRQRSTPVETPRGSWSR